ncbi:hypothetical protein [Tenacibaculum maritimum]|uniref:hypothetical protein n=3 Tax=Tenacibaculum maritimum TaxID=107401 RepID=UPI0010A300A7|nr:hypothetical protein [Tenacibaculum maritimum]MCD9610688.1 hypothetical protein [Tenacibaculum maritimum]QCD63527.1 hypothetical protein B9C57_13735 [Tenacibaculum maritimum]
MEIDIKTHIIFFISLSGILSFLSINFYLKKEKKTSLFLFYFLTAYCILLVITLSSDLHNQYLLYSYDLNKNGIFELNEQNSTQQSLLEKNDLGINLAPFFSIFPSLLLAIMLIFIHIVIKKYRDKETKL